MRNLTLTAARDYRTSSRYEYLLCDGETIVERVGGFASSTQARRAGMKRGTELLEAAKTTDPFEAAREANAKTAQRIALEHLQRARDAEREHQPLPAGSLFDEVSRAQLSLFGDDR